MHTAVIWEHSMKLPKNLASTVSVTHCKQLAKSRLGNLYLIYLNFFTRTWQRSAWTRTTWCRKKAAGQGRAEKIWLCGVGNQAWFNFRNILALFLVACLLVCQPQLSSVLAQSYAHARASALSFVCSLQKQGMLQRLQNLHVHLLHYDAFLLYCEGRIGCRSTKNQG